MPRFLTTFIVCFLLISLSSETTSADLILDLRFQDGVGGDLGKNLTVNSGQDVFVDLLITDTDSSTPLAAEGLLSGGGRLVKTSGLASLSLDSIIQNAGWNESFVTDPTSSGTGDELAKALGVTRLETPGGEPILDGVGKNLKSIMIATFKFIATGPGSIAKITADILKPGVGNAANVTFDTLEELDTNLNLTFGEVNLTINATPVPEPASVLLGGLTAAFGGVTALRRRRASLAQKMDIAV